MSPKKNLAAARSPLASMGKGNAILPVIATPEQSLKAYLTAIRRIAILTKKQEEDLAHRWYEQGDLAAAHNLVMAHLRFVVYIARSYTGYGLPLSDLIQEGNIGLMRAVKKFNPHRGARLITFAVYWIRATIHEYLMKNWRIVRTATTKAQRKLFFKLRNSKKNLTWMSPDEVRSVAKDLNVSEKDVREMEVRMARSDLSLEAPLTQGTEEATSLLDHLPDDSMNPEEETAKRDWAARTRRALQTSLASLDERSRQIIKERWLQPKRSSLQQLADAHGISAERVRQIEQSALAKVRRQLQDFQSP